MRKSDFYYNLPQDLIAQIPLPNRDSSRLLVLTRETGEMRHGRFYDLPTLLNPGDLLVVNDSKVLPARLLGQKIPYGAAIEFLLLEQKEKDVWEILVRPGRKADVGARFSFGGGLLIGEILALTDGGNRIARFAYTGDNFYTVLDEIGRMPLPPYITEELKNNDRYQTVYARELGSAAAPTAGLHFTPELLARLAENGISTAYLTLHVGLGTFRPVKAENISEHVMHSERFELSKETADAINKTKSAGGKVVAVGTTSCRTLEAVANKYGGIVPCRESTDIFITPGYEFKAIDALITNFHLPESTLLMLVSALAGKEKVMAAYHAAIEERYRFFSFGDAMLIL